MQVTKNKLEQFSSRAECSNRERLFPTAIEAPNQLLAATRATLGLNAALIFLLVALGGTRIGYLNRLLLLLGAISNRDLSRQTQPGNPNKECATNHAGLHEIRHDG